MRTWCRIPRKAAAAACVVREGLFRLTEVSSEQWAERALPRYDNEASRARCKRNTEEQISRRVAMLPFQKFWQNFNASQ